jgi:hypothetical protein
VEPTQLISVYCVGGAALGLWLLVRFPRFAPRTLFGSGVALMAALLVAAVVPICLQAIVTTAGRPGALVALLGLVLPTLAAIFWAAACLLRVVAGLMAGMR